MFINLSGLVSVVAGERPFRSLLGQTVKWGWMAVLWSNLNLSFLSRLHAPIIVLSHNTCHQHCSSNGFSTGKFGSQPCPTLVTLLHFCFLSAFSIWREIWGSTVQFLQAMSKWLWLQQQDTLHLQIESSRIFSCSGFHLHFPGYPIKKFLSIWLFSIWI